MIRGYLLPKSEYNNDSAVAPLSTTELALEKACQEWRRLSPPDWVGDWFDVSPKPACNIELNQLKIPKDIPSHIDREERGDYTYGKQSLFVTTLPKNLTQDTALFLIYGLLPDPDTIKENLQSFTDLLGRPVISISNDRGPSLITDGLQTAAGILSNSAGRQAEKEAVTAMTSVIKTYLEAGESIEIAGYSQGASIVQTTLDGLDKELISSPSNLVSVSVLGANLYNWPASVKVTKYVAYADPIPKVTSQLSIAKKAFENIFRGSKGRHNGELVEFAGKDEYQAHDLLNYAEHLRDVYLKRELNPIPES